MKVLRLAPANEMLNHCCSPAVVAGARPALRGVQNQAWVELMQGCWHADPNQRPTFAQVDIRLGDLVPPESTTASTQPAQARGVFSPAEMEEM